MDIATLGHSSQSLLQHKQIVTPIFMIACYINDWTWHTLQPSMTLLADRDIPRCDQHVPIARGQLQRTEF